MARLFGAQRMVLQAIHDAQGETPTFIEDSRIAQATRISLRDMRDWFLTLDNDELVDLALTENGMSASVTAKGRLALGLYRPFPHRPPSAPEPSRSRSKTGRERALVIGISDYPPPIPKLPAVANDVREMASLLGFGQGPVPRPERPPPDRRAKPLRKSSWMRSRPHSPRSRRTMPCLHTWPGTVRS